MLGGGDDTARGGGELTMIGGELAAGGGDELEGGAGRMVAEAEQVELDVPSLDGHAKMLPAFVRQTTASVICFAESHFRTTVWPNCAVSALLNDESEKDEVAEGTIGALALANAAVML